jgi:hypothetical protein
VSVCADEHASSQLRTHDLDSTNVFLGLLGICRSNSFTILSKPKFIFVDDYIDFM